MTTPLFKSQTVFTPPIPQIEQRPPLSEAAKRALAEAEQRRNLKAEEEKAIEYDGRGGLDPARYGDWEAKGLAIDF